MKGLLEASKKDMELAYQVFGLTRLLHAPPIDAALNLVDMALHLVHYKVWRQGVGKGGRRLGLSPHIHLPWPLLRPCINERLHRLPQRPPRIRIPH